MPPPIQDLDDDDEEEFCPLCVEELDLTDKNFKPCPCGYQICQFCYNNIKTTMNGLCPACRRPYDDKSIQYKVVSPEEMAQHRINIAQQQKRKAAARQKEAQKREADHLSRKHLSGLRVRQKNLVYVTGLRPKASGEKLVDALAGKDYFGQYGEIVKIVVAKTNKDVPAANNSIGIYITFVRREDAETCIECVDMSRQEDGSRLRAQYGTTKYCSAYLRGETCTNKNCMFLHEAGDDNESFTRQDLSNFNALSTQEPAQGASSADSPQPQAPPQQVQPVAAAIQDVEPVIHSPGDHDGPALPAHASWADQARRESRTTAASAESPQVSNTLPITIKKSTNKGSKIASESKTTSNKTKAESRARPKKTRYPYLKDIPKLASMPGFTYNFELPITFSEMDAWIVRNMPPLFDPNEGTRRRLIRERQLEEMQRQQAEAAEAEESVQPLSPSAETEGVQEQAPGGSSQLGGEPEELSERAFGQQNFLQQQAIGSNPLLLDQDFNEALSGLGSSRASGQQQAQIQQQSFLQQSNPNNLSAGFLDQASGHGRQPSRYFLNEAMGTVSKNQAKQMNQAQYGSTPTHNAVLGSQFSYSNIQGPPPGIKTTGTPPITSGMFAQGHGFQTGQSYPRENEKFWDMQRGRGNADGPDSGKQLLQALDQGYIEEDLVIPGLSSSFQVLPQHIQALPGRRSVPIVPPGLHPPSHQTAIAPKDTPPAIPAAAVASSKVSDTTALDLSRDLDPADKKFSRGPSKAEIQHVNDDFSDLPPKNETTKSNKNINSKEKSSEKLANITKTRRSPKKSETKSSQASPATTAPKTAAAPSLSKSQKSLDAFKSEEISANDSPLKEAGSTSETSGVATYAESFGKKPAPGSLTLNTTATIPTDNSIATIATRISRPPSAAPSLTSRPQTPSTEALSTPIKRMAQPRTLRITEAPRIATPPVPIPDTLPPVQAQAGSKVSSRRPSLSSINQPGTPHSETVDLSSIPSASKDVSRASSPPPLAGKKRGEKKTRKAKRVTTESNVLELEVLKVAEEQSPIMGRKMKSKKPDVTASSSKRKEIKDSRTVSPLPVAESAASIQNLEATQEPPVLVSEQSPIPSKPQSPETPQSKNKRVMDNFFASLGPGFEAIVNSALTQSVSTTSHLRNMDHQTGPHQRPFSHAEDISAFMMTQDPFVLSPADHAKRTAGQPIRRHADDGRISSRMIETLRGTRLRYLTEMEEDQLVELEDRICSMLGTAFWGGGSLEYALPSMPGYDLKQKQAALANFGSFSAPEPHQEQQTRRDDVLHSTGHEDPTRFINQFIFNQETEAITPMVPFVGEKAHNHLHHQHSGSGTGAGTGAGSGAGATPTSTAEYSRQHNVQQQEDDSTRLAGSAARAAAAMGNTREAIQQVMGTSAAATLINVEEAERRWQEEKKYVDGLERRLNGVVKRNRKVLSGAVHL